MEAADARLDSDDDEVREGGTPGASDDKDRGLEASEDPGFEDPEELFSDLFDSAPAGEMDMDKVHAAHEDAVNSLVAAELGEVDSPEVDADCKEGNEEEAQVEAPVEADPVKFEAEVVLREWGVAVAKSAEAVHFVIQPRCQTWSCKCLALALVTEDSSVTTRWLCRDEEDDVGRFVCVDKYNRMHYANHTEKRKLHIT